MTFAEMFGEVNTNFSSHPKLTATSSTKSKEFVNRAYLEMALQYRFHETEVTDTSISTVASTVSVAIPTSARRIISVRDTTNKILLKKRDIEWYESQDQSSDAESVPEYWIRYAALLLLWPTPNSVNALQIRYLKLPTALSADGDTPDYPSEWHPVIMLLASSMAGFWLSADTKAMNFKSEALGLIAALSEDPVADEMNTTGQIAIARTRRSTVRNPAWPQSP